MGMVDQIALAETHRDVVLEFIHLILPVENIIPNSYNLIKNSIAVPDIKTRIACKFCGEEVEIVKIKGQKTQKICKNELCVSKTSELKSKDTIKIFSSNIASQMKVILNNHHHTMQNYAGKHFNTFPGKKSLSVKIITLLSSLCSF